MDLMSDAEIKAPVIQMADLHSDIHQKSFLYVFNHQSVFGDYPVVSVGEWKGIQKEERVRRGWRDGCYATSSFSSPMCVCPSVYKNLHVT